MVVKKSGASAIQLSAISYQLSVISYQLSVKNNSAKRIQNWGKKNTKKVEKKISGGKKKEPQKN